MSEPAVQRLKELLFEKETREITDLSHRLDAVFERAGTEHRFRTSVAGVIDGALRDAEVARHRELADAIAPLVVRTVRTEINASQDLLVEALYPKTGELVRKYVASAMRDLVADLNRRLESSLPLNRWVLKAKSIFTGRSMAELAIADAHAFAVEDLYLVRRGSGELIEHWARPGSAAAPGEDDAVFGSVLAAITGFADQALAGEAGALRTLEIGDRVLYVRASPAHLLAARCRSQAPPSIEQLLDEELMLALGSRQAADAQRETGPVLEPLATRLEAAVRAKQAALGGIGPSPLKVLATVVLLPLLALVAWQAWVGLETWSVRRTAAEALERTGELRGYPVQVSVPRGGASVLVSGLSPTADAKARLMARLRAALPGVRLDDQLAALPEQTVAFDYAPQIDGVRGEVGALRDDVKGGLGALEARLQRAHVLGATRQIAGRLGEVARGLDRLAGLPEGAPSRAMAGEARALVAAAIGEMAALQAGDPGEARLLATMNGAVGKLRTAAARVAAASGDGGALPGTIAEAAGELQRLADVIGAAVTRAGALSALAPLEARIAALDGELARLKARPVPEPDRRKRLERAAREHAVFFANGTDFRDDAAAARAVEAIATAMAGFDGIVRVIGYTDDRGNASGNTPLAQARAQKVADALVARGVARGRLVVVGRVVGHEISPETGTQSPNRRVFFEVGFRGEVP